MPFWSSDRDPFAAVIVLRDVGRALSGLVEGGLVKEQTLFLENLKNTLEAVNKAMKEGLFPHDLQENITAIRKSLLDAEVEMVSSMGLNEDEVKNEDMKSVTSRFYMKITYYERFSKNIMKLREEVAMPLSGLHSGVTTMVPQNPSRSWETIKRSTAESTRYTEKILVHQIREWLRPAFHVQDIYQVRTDKIHSSNCDWFFSKKEYVDWSTKSMWKGTRILWISGIYGARRTQITARVIERLREDERTVACFTSRGTLSRGDIRSVVATLCWELLNQFPEDVRLLTEVFNRGCEPTETNIGDCLQRMCQKRHATIILDGLDEYLFGEKEAELCRLLVSLNSVCSVMVFSRKPTRIISSLKSEGASPLTINCEADFRKEIEETPARYTAKLRSSDEKTGQGVNPKMRAYEKNEEQAIYFPSSREDQSRVYAMLRDRASRTRLPAHVARQIIDQAGYWVKSTFETNAGEAKGDIPYLLSDPIDGASRFPVRKIITTCSHDQVWKEYPDKHGTYKGSDAYFDFIVLKYDGTASEVRFDLKDVNWVYNQLETLPVFHWLSNIRPGDRIGIAPKAIAPGWINCVEMVRIEIFTTFLLEENGRFKQGDIRLLGQSKNLGYVNYPRKLLLGPGLILSVPLIVSVLEKCIPPSRASSTAGDIVVFTLASVSVLAFLRLEGYAISPAVGRVKMILTNSIEMIQKLLRPGVRPGFRRLEWTCTCGESLYSDFEEKNPGSLDQLAARLKQHSGQSSQRGAPASTSQPKKAHTRQGTTVGYNMPGGSSSSSSNGQNSLANSVAGSSGLRTVQPPRLTALQLCIETGKYKLEMSELAHPNRAVTDGEIFAMIREQYERTRHSILPKWARFKKPNKAIFIQFFLGTKRIVSLVDGTLETPSFPPESEVRHNYDYNPCPMKVRPMDSRVFFHHFYAPKTEHPDVFWSERLPWKVGPALEPKDVGWGIHLEESPDRPLFAALMCLLLLLSGAVAGIYAWLMKDNATGVAIGAWLTAVQTLGITAVFFWWS
ncbi:hypothetical protein AALT_g10501 [Alternaria alternata]|nr:hypothetical protein AALT_g10501 [Alternaria alternata]